MVANKDINWIHAKIQNRHRNALGVEKSILGEVLGLFEAAPEFQLVMTLNDASDEELRKLLEGVRHECVILPGGTDVSMVELVEPECKWIPVTERLPELIPCNAGTAYSEAVIVWTTGRKAMVAVWDGIDFLCAADYWESWGEEITHWMPLPEPPKED